MPPKPKREKDPRFLKEIRELPCIACGAPPPSTVSHIKTRGSGGGDEYFNCLPKCPECHMYWESDKTRFLEEHPHVLKLLESLGWERHGTKLWHPLINHGNT